VGSSAAEAPRRDGASVGPTTARPGTAVRPHSTKPVNLTQLRHPVTGQLVAAPAAAASQFDPVARPSTSASRCVHRHPAAVSKELLREN